MSAGFNSQLSRDEQALLTFYRQLPPEEQLQILEAAEYSANTLSRMRELAGRPVEVRTLEDCGYA